MKLLSNALRHHHHDPFNIFQQTALANYPSDLTEESILLLHGGEDISPSIYGQEPIDQCYAPREPSKRDKDEMALVERAVKMGIPIIGICRGAQLLCAMDGGTLYQHSLGHSGIMHTIYDCTTNKEYITNSAHHQIMRPLPHNPWLAYADKETTVWEAQDTTVKTHHTAEIVYFPRYNAIGIQGHPEWNPNKEFVAYCTSLIKQYLLKE